MKSEITLTFHLHGPLRKIGDQIELQLPYGTSVEEALVRLFARYPELANWQNITRCAMDMEYLSLTFSFTKNADIHLIPPVSGG